MQAFIYLPCSSLPLLSTKSTSNTLLFPAKHHHHHQCIIKTSSSTCISSIKAAASSDSLEVDYNSMESSVFPAEACETLGGVACDVEMFPETKLKQQTEPPPKPTSQILLDRDREYLQYDSPKTVFIAEACEDLGGEFCEPAYQSGVN
ncbi:hypothetical protein SSX86_007204 [Deinandra increscens subsp. villosa]|uniref:Uncharacterized protein n=1 Tax=Deinandra increscens subsp. villosa TaxID=3103831 RepID=A0AAP0DGB6_9ASTR